MKTKNDSLEEGEHDNPPSKIKKHNLGGHEGKKTPKELIEEDNLLREVVGDARLHSMDKKEADKILKNIKRNKKKTDTKNCPYCNFGVMKRKEDSNTFKCCNCSNTTT